MTQHPDILPSTKQHNAASRAGETAVRQALARVGIIWTKRHPALALAVGFGAVANVGEYLRTVARDDARNELEDMAMAYLRGAIRGTNGPVHEDGRPYTADAGHG